MLWGAAIGDIAGSRFEFDNIKTKDFELINDECFFTDDTVLTAAVAESVLAVKKNPSLALDNVTVDALKKWTNDYPTRGYGGGFERWVYSQSREPYGSYGNGAPMRVSSCAWAAETLDEALALAKTVTAVTHNDPRAVLGAQAVTEAIFLARTGAGKDAIYRRMQESYYRLDFTLDEIREDYAFDESTQGTVPQALAAFLEATDFEDAIRNAVSIGGDSDTLACIAGSIAAAFYPVPDELVAHARRIVEAPIVNVFDEFAQVFGAAARNEH